MLSLIKCNKRFLLLCVAAFLAGSLFPFFKWGYQSIIVEKIIGFNDIEKTKSLTHFGQSTISETQQDTNGDNKIDRMTISVDPSQDVQFSYQIEDTDYDGKYDNIFCDYGGGHASEQKPKIEFTFSHDKLEDECRIWVDDLVNPLIESAYVDLNRDGLLDFAGIRENKATRDRLLFDGQQFFQVYHRIKDWSFNAVDRKGNEFIMTFENGAWVKDAQ